MSGYFPQSMIEGILLRLPPKSLLRFLAVDQTVNSLINSPTFIASHSKHSRSNLLIHQSSSDTSSSSSASSSSSTKWFFYTPPSFSRLEHPYPGLSDFTFRFIDSINGIVCLLQELLGFHFSIIFWNPSIGKQIRIPVPSPKHKAIGLGFDSAAGDFKLVRFCHPKRVELYSLAENAWRNVLFPDLGEEFGTDVMFSNSQCFLGRDLHWIAKREPRLGNINSVLMFDVEAERFREVVLPLRLVGVALSKLKLAVIGHCVSVLHYCDDRCNIWSMAEHGVAKSWTKIGKVDLPDGGEVFGLKSSQRVLTTWSNWQGREFRSLHSLDIDNQEMTDLRIQGTTITACDASH